MWIPGLARIRTAGETDVSFFGDGNGQKMESGFEDVERMNDGELCVATVNRSSVRKSAISFQEQSLVPNGAKGTLKRAYGERELDTGRRKKSLKKQREDVDVSSKD